VDLACSLACVIFDVLTLGDMDVSVRPYVARRRMLANAVFYNLALPHVRLAEAWPLTCEHDAMSLAETVWLRGGEGLILKRLDAPYRPGKRSADWRKIKQLKSSVLRVMGFADSSRPYSCLLLRDDQGNETVVKARNNAELAMLQHDAVFAPHPAVGRLLRIEYQGRTESGGYRHPRWDGWEDA
jgi:ATP-dependent DNA ligase